jgi:hypothetical protein
MTKTTTTLAVTALALVLAAPGAQAAPQSVIDAITHHLKGQGFDRIEIDITTTLIDIDAYGAGIEGDFYYTHGGHLIYSDIYRYRHLVGGYVRGGASGYRYHDHDDYDDWYYDD